MLPTDVLIIITIAAFAALTSTAVAVTLNNEALERIYAVRLLIGPQNTQYVKIGGDVGLASGDMKIGLKDANDVVILADDEPTLTIAADGQLTARSGYTPATDNALVTRAYVSGLAKIAASAESHTSLTFTAPAGVFIVGGDFTLDPAGDNTNFSATATPQSVVYTGTETRRFLIRVVLGAAFTNVATQNCQLWLAVDGNATAQATVTPIVQNTVFNYNDEQILNVSTGQIFNIECLLVTAPANILVNYKRLTFIEI